MRVERRIPGGPIGRVALGSLVLALMLAGCDQTASEDDGQGVMVNPDEQNGDDNRLPRDGTQESQ